MVRLLVAKCWSRRDGITAPLLVFDTGHRPEYGAGPDANAPIISRRPIQEYRGLSCSLRHQRCSTNHPRTRASPATATRAYRLTSVWWSMRRHFAAVQSAKQTRHKLHDYLERPLLCGPPRPRLFDGPDGP